MSRIARIDVTHHRLPLDPPFVAAWDSRPRESAMITNERQYKITRSEADRFRKADRKSVV